MSIFFYLLEKLFFHEYLYLSKIEILRYIILLDKNTFYFIYFINDFYWISI
jgi:hypothetical protein